jgi:hypothetical protein
MLLRLASGEMPHLDSELLQRFRTSARKKRRMTGPDAGPPRRTVGQLLALQKVCRDERIAREAKREGRRRKPRDRKLVAARKKVLDFLAGRGEENWEQVEKLLRTSNSRQYDKAARLLVDLRDALAEHGRKKEFQERFHDLHAQHARKASFLKRLTKVGLLPKDG